LLWLSVDDHVTRLLDLLLNGGLGCRVIPHDHLHSTYLAMCDDFKWQPHPWNRISKAFKTKTTGKKVYQRFKFTDGSTRKVRVFPIVVRAEAAVVQMPQARSAA